METSGMIFQILQFYLHKIKQSFSPGLVTKIQSFVFHVRIKYHDRLNERIWYKNLD